MASETGNENLVNIKKETFVKLVSARERCGDWRIKKRRLDKADWDSALVYLRNRQLNRFPIYSDGKYQFDYVGNHLKTKKDMNLPDFSLFALMSSMVNFLTAATDHFIKLLSFFSDWKKLERSIFIRPESDHLPLSLIN